ncbi:MAG: hypothetical protein EU541_06170 [Promethearchaeota archaeon]|nr:MAG: hypothetical protein EU541_06170 [Candidatus Lokiarchaeota archaeon]
MIFEINLIQDTLVVLHYFSLFIVFYLAYQIGKKIPEDNILSISTGFTLYLIVFGLYVNITGLPALYSEKQEFLMQLVYPFLIIYLGGMIVYIFLSEFEQIQYSLQDDKSKIFSYRLTIIASIGYIIFISLAFFGYYDPIFSFFIVLIPFIIATNAIMKKFKGLVIVKRKKPNRWFYAGLSISGFSNALTGFYFMFGESIMIIRYVAVIVGSLLMVYGWRLLPPLSELDWMMKMNQLLIIDNNSSSLLFKYNFTQISEQNEKDIDSDLASSAMSGIDSLLSEILASEGHIKEIEHSGKIVLFLHGTYSDCVLIADAHSDEFKYRLEMFHLNFENKFKTELATFSGEITPFRETESLIREYFSQ